MPTYVPSTEQLVVEVYARDLQRSLEFYRALGFEVLSAEPDFVVLVWENHRFFLEPRPDLPAPRDHPQANVRIMVSDVDSVLGNRATAGRAGGQTDRRSGLRSARFHHRRSQRLWPALRNAPHSIADSSAKRLRSARFFSMAFSMRAWRSRVSG